MSQHIVKKPALDPGAMEDEIQRRLRRGKARMLLSHVLCFLLTAAAVLFLI